MWLRATSHLTYEFIDATPLLLMIRPRSGARQWVAREAYQLAPSVPVYEFTDIFGNLCQRLIAPAGPFFVNASADVLTYPEDHTMGFGHFVEIPQLPDNVLTFLLPSRYCESDRFGQMTWDITSGTALGYPQVRAIVEWIIESIEYRPDSSPFPESAVEVNQKNYGVCRDMAHLGIAMCRSISIPARMVVGYLHDLEPMDLHAWFEAFVGGQWYTFDPVMKDKVAGRIAIAYGRDAADVAIYTQFGPPALYTSIDVTVDLLDESDADDSDQ